MNSRTLQRLVDDKVQYRYIHSDYKYLRTVRAFNYGELTHAESEQIAKFIKKTNAHTVDVVVSCMASKDKIEVQRKKVNDAAWLANYLQRYYATPKQDGCINREYMAERCQRLTGALEMKRSWATKQD